MKEAVAAAQPLKGKEKLEQLVKALNVLPEDLQPFQKGLIAEISALDPEDKYGFAKKSEKAAAMEKQRLMWNSSAKNIREALRRRNARRPGGSIADVGKKDTLPPIRLKIAKYISDGYTLERNLPKALEYLEIARDADPESQAAKNWNRGLTICGNISIRRSKIVPKGMAVFRRRGGPCLSVLFLNKKQGCCAMADEGTECTDAEMNTPAYVRNEEVDEESSHLLSWDEWLREHASQLLLFARQQSRSPEDAEDILQDALVRLARKEASGEFVGGQEAWLSYVFASIRRLAVDYGRKSDRRQKREDEACASERDEDVYTDPWFSSAAADEELKQFMEMQLRKLPSKFSEVIVLKIWGEQTFQQIAETLEISQNTAASRYRYGIDLLRRALRNKKNQF
ncbi:MAG: RNA polymerase sigma factor [Akkermansia muciniphila]